MSKSSLQTEITSLKATLAERDAQIATLTAAAAAAAAPAEKGGKKARKERDPDAPKRAPTAWIVFCSKKRDEAKIAHPTAKMTELTTFLSQMWAALTPEQKAEYKPEPGAVAAPKPPKAPKTPKTPKAPKEKTPKDPDAPKKPVQGYFLFQQQERAKVAPEKIANKVLSERWALLSDEEKAAYKSS